MKTHDATEQAYKNGYKNGYEEGFKEGYEGGVDVGKRNAVKKGQWTLNRDGSGTCQHCRRTSLNVWDYDSSMNYCPHCGADMRGEEDG